MHESVIIGAIIGLLGGVCVARGWWRSWHRTRQRMSCRTMQPVVVHRDIAPLQMLDGRLTLTVIAQAVPPFVRLHATQPFFSLARSQVHQLCDVLSSADDRLREHIEVQSKPSDTTETSLNEKVRFVKRPVSLPHPAILSLTHLTVELTYDELMTFMVTVFSLSLDIENEDATGFYAEPSDEGLHHLMQSGSLIGKVPLFVDVYHSQNPAS